MADGFLSICPGISIGMALPADSPIFGFVRNGDMHGLQDLLRQGMASLRDCDLRGTPLLHVSGSLSTISEAYDAYF